MKAGIGLNNFLVIIFVDSSKVMDISYRIMNRFQSHPFGIDALSNVFARLTESKETKLLRRVATEK